MACSASGPRESTKDKGGDPLTVKVSAGDYFTVPAGMYHWFALIKARHIKAIRLFKDTTSWVPHYR